MSRGEIIEHIGEGKYKVRQKFAQESVANEISKLSTRIADLAVALPTAKLELLQAESLVGDKARDIDLLIPDFQAGVDGSRDAITKAQSELVALQAEARKLKIKTDELIAENLAALKRRNQLQSAPESKDIEAWCADYTLDLAGEVGIADINDEGGQGVVIQPGYNGAAAYEAARDGELYHNIAQSSAQVYFNAAVMPGVQKWLPRYRVGEITTITNDICTVALDSAESSAQGLPINETESLTDIPIVYMDCNGSAFSEGDRVIVRFTKNGPLVVGFESNPESCSLFGFVFEPANYAGVIPPKYKARKNTYGKPFKIEEMEINPPLGTPGGDRVAWTALPKDGILEIDQGNTRHYGNKNWFNSDKIVLSWSGPPGRVHRMDALDLLFTQFQHPWQTQPYVYHDLRIILDLSQEPEAGQFVNVFGAALYSGEGGQQWLTVIASDKEYAPEQKFQQFSVPVDAALQPLGPLQSSGQYTLEEGMYYQTHFYFSEDGKSAVCTIVGDLTDKQNLHIDLVRYVNGGFSKEEIWSRANPIGNETVVDTYADLSGASWSGTKNVNAQSEEHDVPIYCEFIGDREVTVFERWPSLARTQKSTYSIQEGDGTSPIVTNASRTDSESRGGKFSIVTSDDKVLFEAPFKLRRSRSLTYAMASEFNTSTSGDPNENTKDPGAFFATLSEDEKRGGIVWAENILAIDARFEFCAVNLGDYEYTLDQSVSKTMKAVTESGGSVQAQGSITGNQIIETIEIWLQGEKIKEIEALTKDGYKSIGSFSASNVDSAVGVSGANRTVTTAMIPAMPLAVGSDNLLTAGAYYTGPHTIASFAMNYVMGPTTRKPIIFNYLSGYSDPVSQILQRSESAGYMLCSVSLV